jgi:hypothetical protein
VDADGARTGEQIPATYASMPSGDVRRQLANFNNYAWWPPTSGNAFSATVLRRIMPIPEAPFRRTADYYLLRAATLCGPIRSLNEIGACYRLHGGNDYVRAALDLAQVRLQIAMINDTHDLLRQFAGTIQFDGYPAHASDTWDLPFFALRMTSLRLNPVEHPLREDRLVPLARRGAAVALRQTQRSVAYRWLAVAWFGAVLLSPLPIARSLAEWFFYPHKRPRGLRPTLARDVS